MNSSKTKHKPGLTTFCCVFFEKLKFAFLLFFLTNIWLFPAFSQNQAKKDSIKSSTESYIQKFDTLVSVRLSANSEYDFFEVYGDGFDYDIRPNVSLSNKLTLSYRFISLNIGFVPKFIPGNNDNDMQGKTKSFSLGLNINPQHLIQNLQYVTVKGFYLHNTGDFDTDWNEDTDPYIQFPELGLKTIRGATGYKFNPNFSMTAFNGQTEKQLRSCGSLITILNYDWFNIDNKSSDPSQSSSQKTNNFALTGSIGYMYTFVLQSKFYTSLGVLPGVGFQHTKLLTRTPDGNYETKYTDPVFRMAEKGAIGYNSDHFFTGAEISLSQTWHKQNKSAVQTKSSRIYFQVFLGYRFNAPRFLKKETDALKSIAPEIIKKNLQ
jgi:hypothetical protein